MPSRPPQPIRLRKRCTMSTSEPGLQQATATRLYGLDGRIRKAVEVAGLHPATESVIPYIIGHIIPVPPETGASYGDLDEQYLTASYRVLMDEAQGKRVFAYIKRLQASSPVWNAATYNCVAFIQDIARNMGLRVPGNHMMYPEDWVNGLGRLMAEDGSGGCLRPSRRLSHLRPHRPRGRQRSTCVPNDQIR